MGQKYSAEYKEDVLKLADEIGVRAACEQLGLSTKTVYNWRRGRAAEAQGRITRRAAGRNSGTSSRAAAS